MEDDAHLTPRMNSLKVSQLRRQQRYALRTHHPTLNSVTKMCVECMFTEQCDHACMMCISLQSLDSHLRTSSAYVMQTMVGYVTMSDLSSREKEHDLVCRCMLSNKVVVNTGTGFVPLYKSDRAIQIVE